MKQTWQKLADFLHTANLIPLVVLVSTYHYYHALRSHDPLLVALPIALFVDLLHYRTVQQAVRCGERLWQITAVFTTLMAFGLQWMFYNLPTDEVPLPWWQTVLFASLVPVGLAIMAWHHQVQEQEKTTDWQTRIAQAEQQTVVATQEAEIERQKTAEWQTRATQMQNQLQEMQADAERERSRANEVQAQAVKVQRQFESVQQELAQMQERMTEVQTRFSRVQTEADTERGRANHLQQEVERLQTQQEVWSSVAQAWHSLNPEVQTLALFNAHLLTAEDSAQRLGVHVTTIRRRAKQLNGVGEV